MTKVSNFKFNYQLISRCAVILIIVLLSIGCSKGDVESEDPLNEDPPEIIMTITNTNVLFDYFEDNKSIVIVNEGNTAFTWNWDNNGNTFVLADQESGSLAPNESIELNLSLDRSELNNQVYDVETFIYHESQSIGVSVQINHYQEKKWLIEGSVIDAEYDRVNDLMVVVTEGPNELRAYNMTNTSVENIVLNLPPKCVSVSQDGNYAVVGHNGYFSYINLMTMEVISVISVTADVYDIILTPNNWVYVFPRDGQWERIRCINLVNGQEYLQTGNYIRHRTKAKLHPSGDYIYGADTDVSPSDFEKYDVVGGTATYLYDSPYHGDFAFSGDIWISDDGQRLFSKSRNVFKASNNESTDMTYNGEIEGEGNIISMDFSTVGGKVCVIPTLDSWNNTASNTVQIYETQYLGYQESIELPDFLIPNGNGGGTIYEAHGYLGFFNTVGTSFFTLVRMQEGSNSLNEWAIATIDFD